MHGVVKTEDFKRLLYNTKLYAVKSGEVQGDTLWIKGAVTLRTVATDDFVILSDSVETDGDARIGSGIMSLNFLELLTKNMNDYADATFDLTALDFTENPARRDVLADRDALVYEVGHYPPSPAIGFAVSPSRLTKLRLIKPNTYPIDLRAFTQPKTETNVIGFKVGPTVQGVIAPLDREGLTAKFGAEVLW